MKRYLVEKGVLRMKWTTEDIEQYFQAQEYVDTAIVPLVSVNWKDQIKSSVSARAFMTLLVTELERQFRGRVMLFPSFTYLSSEDLSLRTPRLQEWTKELQENGMPHLFYLTCDSTWKEMEQKLAGTLLWLPSLPIEHLAEKTKQKMMQEQVEQVMPLFMREWKKSQKDT